MYITETKRLGLRKLDLFDLEALHEILGDTATMRYYPSTYNLEQVKGWIIKSMVNYSKYNFGLWAAILKETETFIGQCGISMQNIDGELAPEIGYHINRNFWNKGYATEVAKASLNYGFKHLNLESIYIHTYVKNIPSQRIAEKIGMKKIKIYDKYIKSHDVTWPHVVYRMNKSEFMDD
jgi:RimJ/RimL family protein N-acetyltransferase